MNNKEFISQLSRQTRFTTRNTQILVDALVAALTDKLDEDTQVVVPDFGTFEVKKKLERVFVNPNTGQRLMAPPKLTVNFKANPRLKDGIAEKGGRRA